MDTHTPAARRPAASAGVGVLNRLEGPCWVLEGVPAPHFGTHEEADAECVMLAAEMGTSISASQRLRRRCITVTCECGSYLLGEDDTEASTHFRSRAAVTNYIRSRGLKLSSNGLLPCTSVHETSDPTPALDLHIGRAWSGNAVEAQCPCPKSACGLIRAADVLDSCTEHADKAGKSILQLHSAQACAELLGAATEAATARTRDSTRKGSQL